MRVSETSHIATLNDRSHQWPVMLNRAVETSHSAPCKPEQTMLHWQPAKLPQDECDTHTTSKMPRKGVVNVQQRNVKLKV